MELTTTAANPLPKCCVPERTQVMMEKNEKAMAALAASAPVFGLTVVFCHWLARKQKPTNHRKDQKPTLEKSPSVP